MVQILALFIKRFMSKNPLYANQLRNVALIGASLCGAFMLLVGQGVIHIDPVLLANLESCAKLLGAALTAAGVAIQASSTTDPALGGISVPTVTNIAPATKSDPEVVKKSTDTDLLNSITLKSNTKSQPPI